MIWTDGLLDGAIASMKRARQPKSIPDHPRFGLYLGKSFSTNLCSSSRRLGVSLYLVHAFGSVCHVKGERITASNDMRRMQNHR